MKELEKLRAKLKEAEGEEKESKDEKPENEGAEGGATLPKDNIPRDEPTVTANGDLREKSAKDALLTGVTSLDSDSTAVNTPNGSATPTKENPISVTTETVKDDDTVEASALRQQVQHLEKLIKFLEKEFEPTRQKLRDLAVTGEIKFSLLWALFRLGSVITFRDNESGLVMAGEVSILKIPAVDNNSNCRLQARITYVEGILRNISIFKLDILTITDHVSIMHGNDCTQFLNVV